MKKIFLLLLILVIVVFVMYFHLFYNIGYKKGYEAGKQDNQKTEIISPAKKEIPPNGDYLLNYFDKNELEIISIAALRNDCKGDNFFILLAIRKSEEGPPGNEFGVKTPYAKDTNLNKQAGAAAFEVVKYRKLWMEEDRPEPFIKFMGDRYCPTTGNLTEKEKELNKNWIPNVTFWYKKLKPE